MFIKNYEFLVLTANDEFGSSTKSVPQWYKLIKWPYKNLLHSEQTSNHWKWTFFSSKTSQYTWLNAEDDLTKVTKNYLMNLNHNCHYCILSIKNWTTKRNFHITHINFLKHTKHCLKQQWEMPQKSMNCETMTIYLRTLYRYIVFMISKSKMSIQTRVPF